MKNLNTILPFYDKLSDQNNSKEYVYENIFLLSERNRLLPFVLRRDHDAAGLTGVTLQIYDTSDNLIQTLTPATYLTLNSGTTYDYLSYNGTLLAANLDTGLGYYIKLYDGTSNWYSEVFAVKKITSTYITLEFSNDNQLANILASYEQKVYINTVLKVPEYVRTDEATEKNAINIYKSQILQKVNLIQILNAPEYLVDALMLLPMMDNITLTVQSGDEIEVQQIEVIDPEWNGDNYGSTSKLVIKLIEFTIIKRLNFTEMACTSAASNIRQGTASLTANVQSTIVFSSSLDSGYSISGRAYDSNGNMVLFTTADETTAGFKVTANKDCTFEWSAIKE